MKIKGQLKKENNEFVSDWRIKRKVGGRKYIITGIIKLGLFSLAIVLANNLIKQQNTIINISEVITILIISVLAPIVSWYANEYRYDRSNKINNLSNKWYCTRHTNNGL